MESIGNIFGHATARWARHPDFRAGMAALAWESVLGPEVASHVQLVRLDQGIGWVRTSSPVWAHQLTFLKPDILRRMADKLGPNALVDLRLSRGIARPPSRAADLPAPPPLTADQQHRIDRCVADVEDPALHHALERAMSIVMQREAWLQDQGWLSCTDCGALTDAPRRLCLLCRHAAGQRRHADVVAALQARPWATVWDVRVQMPDLRAEEFGRVRALLLKTSWAELQSYRARYPRATTLPPPVVAAVQLHLMLRTLRPWDRMDPVTIEHYAGRDVARLLASS